MRGALKFQLMLVSAIVISELSCRKDDCNEIFIEEALAQLTSEQFLVKVGGHVEVNI